MARIRTLKPEFFRSRSLAKCDRDARLTFAGLWTEADDHGHGVADPRILKGAIWPLDDDVTHRHVSAHLRVLVETGHIRLYEVDGETYYEVVNWAEHQAAAYRRGEPKHPAPQGYLDDVSHEDVQESAGGTRESAGREGKGTGKGTGNREGARKRAHQLPEGWSPDPDLLNQQKSDHPNVNLDRELTKFRNHWQSKGETRKDWAATWRNWVLKAEEFARGSPGATQPPPRDADYSDGWKAAG